MYFVYEHKTMFFGVSYELPRNCIKKKIKSITLTTPSSFYEKSFVAIEGLRNEPGTFKTK